MSASNIISYTDFLEVKSELALQQDANGSWIMWQIPIDTEVISHYCEQANEQTTIKFGDLTSNNLLFPLGKQYATKWASLRLVQTMSINWQISGMAMGIGNVNINRLPALIAAMAELKERLKYDLDTLYTLLSDVTPINSYVPQSPYVTTGGSGFWP